MSIAEHLYDNDYVVDTDVLPQEDYDFAKEYLHSGEIPWFFLQDVTFSTNIGMEESNYGFSHILYANDNNTSDEDLHPNDKKVIDYLVKYLDKHFVITGLKRVRAGLQTVVPKPVIHHPHTDFDEPHYTALFYFCTDKSGHGTTIIYDKKSDHYLEPINVMTAPEGTFNVVSEVQPEENSVLIFKGNVFHSSTTPKEIGVRIAVNVNFYGYPRSEGSQDG